MNSKKNILAALAIMLLAAGCNSKISRPIEPSSNSPIAAAPLPNASTTSPVQFNPKLVFPIANALDRITKKPFGIYVTPKNSPVSPEKFTGFHTGVDFETTAEEQNIDVPIFAACQGRLLLKKYASGYGGVAVQSCKLDGNDITVIYGHLKLSSIILQAGDNLNSGEKIGLLGKGYSSETDGERKHLHFGIHKGTSIVLLGYVQQQAQLTDWLDAAKYLK